MSAECRTGHLEVRIYIKHLCLEVCVVNVYVGSCSEELNVSVQIYIKVCAVCAETCVKSCSASRSEVSSDVGSAIDHDLRLEFLYCVYDNLCISVCCVMFEERAVVNIYSVSSVSAEFCCDAVYVITKQDAAQLNAELVSKLSSLGDKFKCCRHHFALTLLTEYPYVLESSYICTVVSHVCPPFLDDVLACKDMCKLVSGFLAGAFKYHARLLNRRCE